jgi:hypothetical protein
MIAIVQAVPRKYSVSIQELSHTALTWATDNSLITSK